MDLHELRSVPWGKILNLFDCCAAPTHEDEETLIQQDLQYGGPHRQIENTRAPVLGQRATDVEKGFRQSIEGNLARKALRPQSAEEAAAARLRALFERAANPFD